MIIAQNCLRQQKLKVVVDFTTSLFEKEAVVLSLLEQDIFGEEDMRLFHEILMLTLLALIVMLVEERTKIQL